MLDRVAISGIFAKALNGCDKGRGICRRQTSPRQGLARKTVSLPSQTLAPIRTGWFAKHRAKWIIPARHSESQEEGSEMRSRIALLFLILSAGLLPRAWAQAKPQEEFNVREHYTKYEYRIPMRDGVHLFTSVYVPKDTSVAYPFLVDRTPYSVAPYGEDQYRSSLGPSEAFERAGYIFVYQDVRGRYMSEGKFVEMRPHIDEKRSNKDVDDSSDMYDTVDWLLRNVPNNNGKVGIWGISYPGFFTSASIIDSHPAIKAASPQAPMTDLFMGDDAYHGGAFMLAANFGFYVFFKPQDNPTPPRATPEFDYGTQSAYEFFLKLGPLANANARYFHDQSFLWSDQVGHDHLRRLLEGAQPRPAHEEHSLRRADGGRMVRRGGPFRPLQGFPLHRAKRSGHLQWVGGRPLGARRLGALGWRSSGQRQLCRQDCALLPRQHSVSLFRKVFEGEGN